MSYPRKRDKIGEKLSFAIRTRCEPGARLPGERDFARSLGITRRTLRFVLDDLERRGMIVRSRCGTFVKRQDEFQPPGDEPVTVLLPCPDFMTASGRSTVLHCSAIRGAMQAATAAGSRVVTIPVSTVNDPEKIDMRRLSSLHRGSRVMMVGTWFRKIFPLLREHGCRVGVIGNQNEDLLREDNWYICCYNTEAQPGVSARFLHQQGARKIFYFGSDLARESSGSAFFRQALEELGLRWDPACFQIFPAGLSLAERLKMLAKLWRETAFDGLIMEINPLDKTTPAVNFYRATGIPGNTLIAVSRCDLLQNWPAARNVWVRRLPIRDAAMEITRFLLGQTPAQHRVVHLMHIPLNEYINQYGEFQE